jgi:hypothetical protein
MSNELRVALVAGVLAFVGGISGTYLSGYLEQERADRQFRQEYRVHMLDKRIAVIDQCTHAIAALPREQIFMKYQNTMISYGNSHVAANVEFQKSGPSDKLLTLQKEISTIQTEYQSCLVIAPALFGPKSVAASKALNHIQAPDPNDDAQNPLFSALISAMIEEASYFDDSKSR